MSVKVASQSTLTLPRSCWGATLDIELSLPLATLAANMNLTLRVLAGNSGSGVPVRLTTVSFGGHIVPSLDGVPFRIGQAEPALELRVVVDVVTVEALFFTHVIPTIIDFGGCL